MQRMLAALRRIAPTDRPVLVQGPTGSGKEVVALEVHRLGRAPAAPFIDLNCSAIPEALLESELFGHERGAFTGADSARRGHAALVGEGTLFLDEIGDLPLPLQPKLLRLLEARSFRAIGGSAPQRFAGRVIAATHRNLDQMVRDGSFREDLLYRLNVFTLEVPSLSQRREDIAELAAHFAAAQHRPLEFSREALALLVDADWPGNVRQLRNVIERLAVLSDERVVGDTVVRAFLGAAVPVAQETDDLAGRLLRIAGSDKIAAAERLLIDRALIDCDGNKAAAARTLGINRKVIERRLKQLSAGRHSALSLYDEGVARLAVSDHQAAVRSFAAALELLRALPPSDETRRRQYEILCRLGICVRSLEGWLSERALGHYHEALRVGRGVVSAPDLAAVLFGVWSAQLMRLELGAALDTARELRARGEEARDPSLVADGLVTMANTLFWLGRYAEALDCIAVLRGIDGYERLPLLRQGLDPVVLAGMLEGLAAFQLGRFRQARAAFVELLGRTRASAHPFNAAIGLQGAAWIECLGAHTQACGAFADELIALAQRHGFTFHRGMARIFAAAAGQRGDGAAEMHAAFHDDMHRYGGLLFHSLYALLLGRAQLAAGRARDCQTTVDHGLAVAQRHHEHAYLCELLCLRARALGALGHAAEHEQELAAALSVAVVMGSAPGWIEATVELARLWLASGQRERARCQLTLLIERYAERDGLPLLDEAERLLADAATASNATQGGVGQVKTGALAASRG